tara:strand:- start:435 stop:1901 length:1467 start_codon:yes stop_codon:yes gene_type:complete
MSEVKVNKISPRTACGTVTLGDSGDTFTLPSGATMTVASGATITNSGTASGFAATGETSWDTTVKTNGTFTATAGIGYFLNTTAGTITVNLPAGSAGDSVALADYAATWQTNNVTVSPNGSEKIGGVNSDITLSTEGQAVTFVYIDSTQGWVNVLDSTSNVRGNAFIIATGGTITCSGDYKIHTFTGPGTFCVSAAAACAANNVVDYVVVAGGGGSGDPGAGGRSSGSGGGGGFRFFATTPANPQGGPAAPLNGYGSPTPSGTEITVSASPYSITVGGGGAAGPEPSQAGCSGNNSTFSTVTSAGGGSNTVSGGSGGGGYHGAGGSGCNGNSPPTTPAQGNNGGVNTLNDNTPAGNGNYVGAGGGGAIAVGGSASASAPYGAVGGAGAGIQGFGTSGENCGSYYYFSGGGGGGGQAIKGPAPGFRTAAVGGLGGGGDGEISGCYTPTSGVGTINTGGGAGGGGCNPSCGNGVGAAGGSGIVIIRYKFQ